MFSPTPPRSWPCLWRHSVCFDWHLSVLWSRDNVADNQHTDFSQECVAYRSWKVRQVASLWLTQICSMFPWSHDVTLPGIMRLFTESKDRSVCAALVQCDLGMNTLHWVTTDRSISFHVYRDAHLVCDVNCMSHDLDKRSALLWPKQWRHVWHALSRDSLETAVKASFITWPFALMTRCVQNTAEMCRNRCLTFTDRSVCYVTQG